MSNDFDGLLQASTPNISDLMAEIFPDLVGYFFRRLSHQDDAFDLAGDTVLELLKKPNRLPLEESDFRRYVFGTARHLLSRDRRSRAREYSALQKMKSVLVTTRANQSNEPDIELEDALKALKESDRELLLLVAWEGFGVAEAGAILGLKPEAARKRYSRVRLFLKNSLSSDIASSSTQIAEIPSSRGGATNAFVVCKQ